MILCRLPKDVVLQSKLSWQTRQPKASTVARYTAALKRAGTRFRAGATRSVRTGSDTPRTGDMPSLQLTAQRPGHAGQPSSAPGLRSPMSEPGLEASAAMRGIATGIRELDTLSMPGGCQAPLEAVASYCSEDAFSCGKSSVRWSMQSLLTLH